MYLVFDSPYESDKLVLDSPYYEEQAPLDDLVFVHDIDAGNANPSTSSVADADTYAPTVTANWRSSAGAWRHFLFALDGANGRRPFFDVQADSRALSDFHSTWRPVWTSDFETWHQAASRTRVGSRWTWQFAEDFDADRVYVADFPIGQQKHAAEFANDLLANYVGVVEPCESADASGVYNTTTAENDDLGRAVGANPQFGLKLTWPGPTTDGARKRKLVVFAGIHAQGENHSWYGFRAAVRWMLDDPSQAAQDVRANWDVRLYFNITPNGIKGGHTRTNFRTLTDPNRDFKGTSALQEIGALRAAVTSDTGGQIDALLSYHGANGRHSLFNVFLPTADFNAGTRQPIIQDFLDLGAPLFGEAASLIESNLDNADYYWGQSALGAKIGFPCEMQGLGTTSLASAETIGRAWVQTLQAVDANGWFVTPDAGALTAASLITTTATGSLTTGIALEGAASSVTLVNGVLTANIRLRGDALSQAIAAAGLTTAIQLAAQAQAGASATGDLIVGNTIDLTGNAQAAALATGSITTIIRFEAAAIAKVLATGDLTVPGSAAELAADATVLAIASGGLTTAIPLQGAAASVVQASGTLDLALTFEAAAFVQAMASGVLSTQVRLDAAAVASAIAAASLTTSGAPLAAHGARRASFRGYQRVTMRRPRQYA